MKNVTLILISILVGAGCSKAGFESAVNEASSTDNSSVSVPAPTVVLTKSTGQSFTADETLAALVSFKVVATASEGATIASLGAQVVDSLGVIHNVGKKDVVATDCDAAMMVCTFSGSFDSKSLKNGSYTFAAYSVDSFSSKGVTASLSLKILNVAPPPAPVISFLSPVAGAVVSGNVVITSSVANALNLVSQTLAIDGAAPVQTSTTIPASFTLNTSTLSNGAHTLTLAVTDTDGKKTSASISIQVSNAVSTVTGTVLTKGAPAFKVLELSGSNSVETIQVSQLNDVINVRVSGVTTAYTGPFQSVVVKGNGGADIIDIESSVKIESLVYCNGGCSVDAKGTQRNTIMTVNSTSSVTSGTMNKVVGNAMTSAWVAPFDQTTGVAANRLHVIADIRRPVEPTDIGTTTDLSAATLFGAGVSMFDVKQGNVGDCYYLAGLQGVAGGVVPNVNVTIGNPDHIREFIVDMGDGHVLVDYKDQKSTTTPKSVYVQVTKKLGSKGSANSPVTGGIWVRMAEKAFTYYRYSHYDNMTNQNTYAAIWGGIQYESFVAMRLKSEPWDSLFQTDLAAYSAKAVGQFQDGQALGVYTNIATTASIVKNHEYSLLWIRTDAATGKRIYTVKNPWGFQSGYTNVHGAFDMTDEAAFKSNFNFSARTIDL